MDKQVGSPPWRRIYTVTIVYGLLTIAALWVLTRSLAFEPVE